MALTPIYGVFEGKVVDNSGGELPSGSLKVHVPAINQTSWFRPCSTFAGPHMGWYNIPPVGAVVWVAFVGGSKFSHGVWLGAWWSWLDSDAGRISEHMNDRHPYNRCFVSESGHTLEFDDTPGEESLRIRHCNGSFIKMWEDNKMEVYCKGDLTIRVDGKLNIQVEKESTLRFGADLVRHITGSFRSFITGSCLHSVSDAWSRISSKIFNIERGDL